MLQRSLASALRPYDDVRNSMLAIGVLLLAVASLLAVWLARSATRPVEDLTKAAQRLEAGDYAVEVPPASTTELRGLASAFNAMRTAVADREATIRHQADHDALTGLPTRARMIGRTRCASLGSRAARIRAVVIVCLIEIQQFQSIIGSFGHAAGDEVLREVARRLAAYEGEPRPRRAYRHGSIPGDPRLRRQRGQRPRQARSSSIGCAALRLRRCLASARDAASGSVASPTTAPAPPSSCSGPISALFRAKETGAAVGYYVEGDDSSHRHRLSILGELRRAIDSNELELHYQPKVDARTGAGGRMRGAGALAASATWTSSRRAISFRMPSARAPSVRSPPG